MKAFFKTLGAGIVYTIASPIYLSILALAMIFAFGKVAVGAVMILVNLINGKNYFSDPKVMKLAQRKKEMLGVNATNPFVTPQVNQGYAVPQFGQQSIPPYNVYQQGGKDDE